MANNRVNNELVLGFSKKSKQEKIKWISQTCFTNPQLAKGILETYWHTDENYNDCMMSLLKMRLVTFTCRWLLHQTL